MAKYNKYLFISVKPVYATKLLTGEKSIELRKVKPNVQQGDCIIIYASGPVKAVVGFGLIKRVIVCNVQEMWDKYSYSLGIDKDAYDMYYRDKDRAIGIEIESIRSISPISLRILRDVDPNFNPPQVYRYVANPQIWGVIRRAMA